MIKSQFVNAALRGARRTGAGALGLLGLLGLPACSGLLDVELPGRIETERLQDPSLAPVLAHSVVSDLECAYSNHAGGSSAHSDEWETANSNVPLANWGERTITSDEDAYAIGNCEGAFGMYFTLNSARFQADNVFSTLSAWTDAEVANRASLMATVKAYGGYANEFMGETFCSVAYDGEAAGPPSAALARAETNFSEAITLAQQASNSDILNMARVGLARSQLMQKKYAQAEATARLVPAGYVKNANRGSENFRRYNEFTYYMTQLGAYTVSNELRAINDPRMGVFNANKGAFNPTVALWLTSKHTALDGPIRLASYLEARLILAEALIQQDKLPEALTILNARRAEVSLPPNNPTTKAAALSFLLEERRAELSFEGGSRLADLLRYQLPWKGANGHSRPTNPFTLRPYGATTCWPLPTKETNGTT